MHAFAHADARISAVEPATTQHQFIEHIPGHTALLDSRGTVLAVNSAWRNFARDNGYVGDDFGVGTSYLMACGAGRPTLSRFSRRAIDAIVGVLNGDMPDASFDYPCHAPDQKRWFRMLVSGCVIDGERHATVSHFNVTDEAESRIAAKQTSRRLSRAGHSKREVAGLIHDVKTPVNAIMGMTDFIRNELAGPVTAKQREYLEHILQACGNVTAMIDNDIRALFDNENEELHDPVDVPALLNEIEATHGGAAREAGITLRVEASQSALRVAMPAHLLQRCVGNLVTNAVRYAGAGSTVRLSTHECATGLKIEIIDDGVGVAASEVPGLLRKRTRGSTARASGTGLGLAVVHDLIRAFGADMTVASDLDQGFEVRLHFPHDLLAH